MHNFEVKIVAFYPEWGKKEDNKVCGTFHLSVIDGDRKFEKDLRGVKGNLANDKVYIHFPLRNGWDAKLKRGVRYQVLTYTSKKLERELKDLIREKCLEYLRLYIIPEDLPRTPTEAKHFSIK